MGKRYSAWLWVALCALAIFFVVPFARAIQAFTSRHFGAAFFIILLLAVVAATFLVALYILIFRLKIRTASQYIWLAASVALYFYIGLARIKNPFEGAHYLEYGLLGCLLFRAWRFSIPDGSVYWAALFSGSLVGIIDEIVQWITPDRYWDMADVGMNALAAGLILIALWKGIRLKPRSAKIAPKSFRIVSILIAANLLLLGACLSNTPERTAACAGRFPFLAPLEKQEPMRETILKHEDPEIGSFYSRLTVPWLKKTDREQAAAYGKILIDWKDKSYDAFLKSHTTLSFPFLHEMRVHLFRRDKRFEVGQTTDKLAAKKDNLFIAYKENLILKKYFGETLKASGYEWPKEKAAMVKGRAFAAEADPRAKPGAPAAVESLVDKSAPYDSPVSKNVFYWLEEGRMWATIIVILVLLIICNVYFSKKRMKIR